MSARKIGTKISICDGGTYGIHTGVFEHSIGKREVIRVKSKLGLKLDEKVNMNQSYYQRGITEVTIKENKQWYPNAGEKIKYTMVLRVNFARIVGIGDFCLVPCETSKITMIIKKMTSLLMKLGLECRNADFSDWYIKRIDIAIDILVPKLSSFIPQLIVQTPDLVSKNKNMSIKYKKDTSVKFGNTTVSWNIYDKHAELLDRMSHYNDIDGGYKAKMKEIEGFKDILRLERQVGNIDNNSAIGDRDERNRANTRSNATVKKILPTRKFGELKTADVRNNILVLMYEELNQCYGDKSFTVLQNDGSQKEVQGIYEWLFQLPQPPPVKRPYGKYQYNTDQQGRIGRNIPRHDCYELEKGFLKVLPNYKSLTTADYMHTYKVAGRSIEDVEEKILHKLFNYFKGNVTYYYCNSAMLIEEIKKCFPDASEVDQCLEFCCQKVKEYLKKSYEDFVKFCRTVKSKKMKELVNKLFMCDWAQAIYTWIPNIPDREKRINNLLKDVGHQTNDQQKKVGI